MGMKDNLLLAVKIKELIKRFEILQAQREVVYGKGTEQCIMSTRSMDTGGGYCWTSDDDHTVFFGFRIQEDDMEYGVRYFEDYDYLCYHRDLTNFTIIRDTSKLSEVETFELIDYDLLTDEYIFQLSTIMSERSLEVYITASYLKYKFEDGVALSLKHIEGTYKQTFLEAVM